MISSVFWISTSIMNDNEMCLLHMSLISSNETQNVNLNSDLLPMPSSREGIVHDQTTTCFNGIQLACHVLEDGNADVQRLGSQMVPPTCMVLYDFFGQDYQVTSTFRGDYIGKIRCWPSGHRNKGPLNTWCFSMAIVKKTMVESNQLIYYVPGAAGLEIFVAECQLGPNLGQLAEVVDLDAWQFLVWTPDLQGSVQTNQSMLHHLFLCARHLWTIQSGTSRMKLYHTVCVICLQ